MIKAHEFASRWEQGWNNHDLDVILSHYHDDILFHSQKAVALIGTGEIKGKPALRAYWQAALTKQPDLAFRVQDVFEGYGMITITYLNHQEVLAAETLYFDESGQIYQAAACHRF